MRPPALLLNIGEPNPGFRQMWDLIFKAGVVYRSYCNGDTVGHDLICDVPFHLAPLFPYQKGAIPIPVSESPPADDPWGVFRYHHAQLYRSALLKMNPVPAILPGVSDLTIASLATAIYEYPDDFPTVWDHLDDGSDGDGVYWALKRLPEADVVVLRGSTTTEDFLRDAMAIAAMPWGHPKLGPVHAGFYLGMPDVWEEVQPLLRPNVPWIATGHSLGAARASILTALACLP